MQVNLKGWRAVPALILILGFGVFRWSSQGAALETDGVEKVKTWLIAESTREAVEGLQRADSNPPTNLGKLAEDLSEDAFEILSVKRHGRGNRIVARVELRHRSNPGKTDVRYFKMSHSMATGWRVQRESSRWAYTLAAF